MTWQGKKRIELTVRATRLLSLVLIEVQRISNDQTRCNKSVHLLGHRCCSLHIPHQLILKKSYQWNGASIGVRKISSKKGSQLPSNDKDDSQFNSSRILIAPTDVESFETVITSRMGVETYAEIVDKLELHNLHWERSQLL